MSNPRSLSMVQGSNGASAVSKTIKSRMLNDEQVKTNIVESRFRIGWPRLVPQPTRTRFLDDPNYYIKDYEERLPIFRAILFNQGITWSKLRLVARKTAGTSHYSYPTLLVEAVSREGNWRDAVLEPVRILETVVVNYDAPIHVEIIERGFDDPRVLPIRANDDKLPIWESLGPSILQTLSTFPVHWRLLSLVNIGCGGLGDQTRPPTATVQIEAWDAQDDIWELEIIPRLSALIADTGISNLEIRQAYKRDRYEWVEDVSGLCERTWWEKPECIGDGMGPWGSPSTGTLGGVIVIEDSVTRKRTWCLLTNSHVVRNHCPGLPTQCNKELNSLNIVVTRLSRDDQKQIDLQMPFWTRWGEFERWKKMSSFKSGDVLKVGRSTKWTSGGLNHARAWLNVRSKKCDTVVQCMRVENSRRQWHPFSAGGDQGSMIFDASDGACVGLLFIGDEGQTYGLITPIEDVFRSIEETTGCKVVLPRLVS